MKNCQVNYANVFKFRLHYCKPYAIILILFTNNCKFLSNQKFIGEVDKMIIIKRIFCLVICISMFGVLAFAYSDTENSEELCIKNNIENTYGLNIIVPKDSDYKNFSDSISILEKSIKKFPDNMIKEITDYYSNNGIRTNIILDETENIKDLFPISINDEKTVNIYIKILKSSLFADSSFASEDTVVHEIAHFVSDYMFKTYDMNKLKDEFNKLNAGFPYGTWGDGYCKVYVNKHSAIDFKEEVADLIWYAKSHPLILRNINNGEDTIIHEKLRLLADAFNEGFNSVSENTNLWLNAIPQNPQPWAKDIIADMKDASLIPEEFNGLYDAHITREDFYKLILNILHQKIGEDNLNNYFHVMDYEEHVALDPVNGEIFVDDGMNYSSYYSLLCNNKKILYQAYNMGILSTESFKEPDGYMTRLEISKILVYIGNELGINFSDYKIVNYNDIESVDENEKPYIYIIADKGILKGDGLNFKPFDYCTYQEAYIILMRFYNLI